MRGSGWSLEQVELMLLLLCEYRNVHKRQQGQVMGPFLPAGETEAQGVRVGGIAASPCPQGCSSHPTPSFWLL